MQKYDWQSLLFELTKKEISVRYKKTFFGFLWMFLNPLSQMLILGFVFQNFTNLTVKTQNYFIFLFIGLLIWNFFSNTVQTTTPIYVNERSLLKKGKFPREIILLSVIFANLFHFVVSLLVLIIFLTFYYISNQHFELLFSMIKQVPYTIFSTFLLGLFITGICLILSALNVKYRDINFFSSAILPLLFYGSPIIWALHSVPQKIQGILYLNPLVSVIEINRMVLLNESITYKPGVYLGILISLLVLVIGSKVFKTESPFFDDWL